MTAKTTLLLVPALAPLSDTANGLGIALRDFARSLEKNDWNVTIVLGIDSSVDTNSAGLARRLEPVSIGDNTVIIHEGSMDGFKLIAIASADGKTAPAPQTSLQAALTLIKPPEFLQVWPGTQSALLWSETLSPAPIAIAHIAEPRVGHTFNDAGLENAKLLVLPSSQTAKRIAKSEPKLAPYSDKLVGLSPGFNAREWNPTRDRFLLESMDPPNIAAKSKAKSALRAELGLSDSDVPLIGVVSRITSMQRSVGEEIIGLDLQIAGVNAGPHMESLAAKAPTKAVFKNPSSAREARQLQHRIVAAADFVLVPPTLRSNSQLYPCRYGTGIIARQRGEVAERLINFDARSLTGCGFLYNEEHELTNAVRNAVAAWKTGEAARSAIIERCLDLDLSWNTMTMRLGEWVQPLRA